MSGQCKTLDVAHKLNTMAILAEAWKLPSKIWSSEDNLGWNLVVHKDFGVVLLITELNTCSSGLK